MSITLNDRLTVPEEVVNRRLADESILLNLETGIYYGLDAVGARFLELLSASPHLGAVHTAMLDEFDVSPDMLESDLLRISEEMLAKGLLLRDVVP